MKLNENIDRKQKTLRYHESNLIHEVEQMEEQKNAGKYQKSNYQLARCFFLSLLSSVCPNQVVSTSTRVLSMCRYFV